MMDYVNIEGDNIESPRLDAMGTNRVMIMDYSIDNSISNIVIENGYFGGEDLCNNNMSCLGGGMYLKYSDPIIHNVDFFNNYAGHGGGGIYMENAKVEHR